MKLHSLLSMVLFAGSALPSHAALVTWGAPTTISGDADVDLAGTLVNAFNVGGPSVAATTINGVTFAPFAIPSGSPTNVAVGNYSLTSGAALTTGLVAPSGAAPFSNLSAPYRTLLGSAVNAFAGFGPVTLTMSGLTVGATYEFEWWANRSNNVASNRSTATAGNSVTLDWNTTDTQGALGQFAIGTFTADATLQTIAFSGPESTALFNGFQLRQLALPTVPEPGTALAGVILAGLLGLRRRREA